MTTVERSPILNNGVGILTDQSEILDILMGGLEPKIYDAVKKGAFLEARDYLNLYLDLEKAFDEMKGGERLAAKTITF